jgi:hypothetical protein
MEPQRNKSGTKKTAKEQSKPAPRKQHSFDRRKNQHFENSLSKAKFEEIPT